MASQIMAEQTQASFMYLALCGYRRSSPSEGLCPRLQGFVGNIFDYSFHACSFVVFVKWRLIKIIIVKICKVQIQSKTALSTTIIHSDRE